MLPINLSPDRKALVEFSLGGLVILGLIAAPLAYYRGRPGLAIAFLVLACLIQFVGLIRPRWLGPIFVGLSIATWPIGWVVSRLAIGLLYFLVFTPIALAFRLLGRDALNRSIDREAKTYWEPYRPVRGRERYLRQS